MTETAASETAAPLAASARPSGRRRAVAVLALLSAVVLASAGWQVTARSYELEPGYLGLRSPDAVEHVAGDVREYRYPMVLGTSHRISISMRNPGPLAVRVTGFGGDPQEWPQSMFPITAIEVNRDVDGNLGAGEPFAPFTLAAQEAVLVHLTVRVDNDPGDGCTRTWWGALPVRYTVLGVDREQQFTLDPVVAFEGGENCAD
ncbi:hypothetical protein QEZ54_28480 [Catellatospora sp. KI3]|uniref:hypothetical protein n=1 Tax=Catellatospora sp. KI3 TaxID=3041620 RepID=UPI0024823883|nr:hypothetical protein [Catellatospora sp. KI3]MDI1464913.1 hypothetical protein [Catellatospora sp. KI3]